MVMNKIIKLHFRAQNSLDFSLSGPIPLQTPLVMDYSHIQSHTSRLMCKKNKYSMYIYIYNNSISLGMTEIAPIEPFEK